MESVLRSTFEELRQLREKRVLQQQRQAGFFALLRQRDESVQRLEEQLRQTPSQSFLILNNNTNVNYLRYKLKLDSYDGSVLLREFLA